MSTLRESDPRQETRKIYKEEEITAIKDTSHILKKEIQNISSKKKHEKKITTG